MTGNGLARLMHTRDKLGKRLLDLRRQIKNQILIYSMGAGPMPPQEAWLELDRLKDLYSNACDKVREEVPQQVESDRERKLEARQLLRELRDRG